jgi:hypothetical protein
MVGIAPEPHCRGTGAAGRGLAWHGVWQVAFPCQPSASFMH